MSDIFVPEAKSAVRLHLVGTDDFDQWKAGQPASLVAFTEALSFTGQAEKLVLVPDTEGALGDVVYGVGDLTDGLVMAGASSRLPSGAYEVVNKPEPMNWETLCTGWADGAYRFEAYKAASDSPAQLIIDDPDLLERVAREENSIRLTRDLINTPAQDMGPIAIGRSAEALALEFGAGITIIEGDKLIDENYPMVHAVGRAAAESPRYAELIWGETDHPHIALVGKGVAFDTGGLNIKTGNYMRLMKKDMGGAAHVLGLARLIMASKLPVKLSVHLPAAENAVGAGAFRPGDVLNTRKGLTVEIDNTDAEGRLLLGDALTRASEMEPDMVIDFATLTGAARVATGPEVTPFMTDDDELAAQLMEVSAEVADPVWRLPLWKPYTRMLQSDIADLSNSAASSFAGTITAGLFLSRFVDAKSWVHFDVWGWREGRYGRPAGGAALALRTVFAMLKKRYG